LIDEKAGECRLSLGLFGELTVEQAHSLTQEWLPRFARAATRLITDEEMARLFRYLEQLKTEGLENYVIASPSRSKPNQELQTDRPLHNSLILCTSAHPDLCASRTESKPDQKFGYHAQNGT
jgi:hypothetical protein